MRKSGASLESMPELIARWVGHLGFTVEAKFAPSGDEEAFPHRVALSGPDARLFRMQEVMAMGLYAAEKARELGTHTLGALSARERRWVHLVVSREEGLGTESEGVGTFKPVRVFRK